jgi:hypothetical protein
MNVQILTDPFGRLLRASPALPGSTHDLTAARQHGIIEALTEAGLRCWADKAYQGAGGPVRVPFRGRRLKMWKRRHNTTHAKIRCLGEQAMATLKGWRLLRKLRCSTNRITNVVKARPCPSPRISVRLGIAQYVSHFVSGIKSSIRSWPRMAH